MAKDKISDYSSTANSNTDIAGINIDEGCAPSGINDAIRTLMAQLKNFQQGTGGDSFNGPFAGTTIAATDTTDASSTTAAAMKTAGGLAVAKKAYIGLDANISGLTVGKGAGSQTNSTVLGTGALAASNSGQATAIGFNSLAANTTGRNVGVGLYCLTTNTTGTFNNAFGDTALYYNTTGGNNTAVGVSALQSNTTASNNTAVGYQAGFTGTTATDVVALGYKALYANTNNGNTAVGSNAMVANTTGYYNAALGTGSLSTNTTGASNTAIGYAALLSNTTGGSNTAVGYQAGYSNTTRGRNTYIGSFAGYTANQTTGDAGNTYVGYEAGYFTTTGYANTFLGGNGTSQLGPAGYNNTTGNFNTFLGVSSGFYVTTGSKNTILGSYNGNQGGLDIRTASNYIVLSDGDGNPRGIFDNSGNLLVGATSAAVGYRTFISANTGVQLGLNAPSGQRYTAIDFRNNDTYKAGLFYDATNDRFYAQCATAGVYLANAGTSWTSASDERVKDIIEPIENATEKLSNWRTVVGKYKTDLDGVRRSFLIAQDVLATFPEAVDTSDENEYGVRYQDTIPVLVKAIQEQQAIITQLQADVAALKGQA
jgi:hypothetical protein